LILESLSRKLRKTLAKNLLQTEESPSSRHPWVITIKLTVTHSMDQAPSKTIEAVSGGWPKVLSNLKSLLETGQIVVSRRVDCRGKAA